MIVNNYPDCFKNRNFVIEILNKGNGFRLAFGLKAGMAETKKINAFK